MKSPLTVAQLEALAAKAIGDVLKTQFKIEQLQHGAKANGACDVAALESLPVALVPLHGVGVEGAVSVRVGTVLAARMLETMVGTATAPEDLDAALVDLSRELCNMLAGRFSAYLAEMGHAVDISIPESASAASSTEDATRVAGSSYHGLWWCDVQPLEVRFDLRTIR